ncbi:MAG: 3'-5' exonuclease, partial [Planctomycetota bacterium]
ERLRTLAAFEVTESARYLGTYRVANLEIFYAELLDALEEGAGDAHAVLRTLRRQLTAGQNAAEGRPQEAERDAVRIFTVHKSKGLEFKHVYLLQTQRKPQASRRPSLDVAPRGSDTSGFEFLWFGAASPGWCAAHARREKREAAERVRNLYVALTRAEERLVVSGTWPPLKPSKNNKDPNRSPMGWQAAKSFCDLLYAREDGIGDPEGVYSARARAEREGETRLEKPLGYDVPGARVSIPSLAAEGEAAARFAKSAEVETLSLPSEKEFLRRSEELRVRRAHAAALQALPYDDSPSNDLSEAGLAGSASGDEAPGIDRRLAQRIGTEVHRILEQIELESDDPGEELDAARDLSTEPADCLREVDEVLSSFRESPLFPRLFGSAGERVIARELPCLLEPTDEDQARGVISGVMDLVLQDTESGAYTIVDYKTDRVTAKGQPLAERYSSQLALYARALKSALSLSEDPKCELWYLRTGEAHKASGTGA